MLEKKDEVTIEKICVTNDISVEFITGVKDKANWPKR
jgi:hypothetical protein